MSQEMDISWQELSRIVRQWGGPTVEIAGVRTMSGGCISTTLLVELLDGRKAVCKVSPHRIDRSYVNEAHQLQMMAELGLPVPQVYAAQIGSLDDPFSYILMEHIPGITLQHARAQCTAEEFDALQRQLAEMLLALHEQTSTHYGRAEIEPPATTFENWPNFFRHVFDPVCDEIAQNSLLPIKCRKHIQRTHDRLERVLRTDEEPRLLHWDVWHSNILASRDASGKWRVAALLDPNCKFGDIETELAYMSLFRTSTPAFMRAYQLKRRLTEGYHQVRKPVYQMYFLMNNVQMFGNGYTKPLIDTVERVAAVV